jgi:hypothetical protein
MTRTYRNNELGRVTDLTGKVFGRLRVLSFAGRNRWRCALWLCECRCGQRKIVLGANLRKRIRGVVSCGCVLHRQRDLSGTPEYATWGGMIQRCADAGNPNYGGRGIQVCDRWLSFEDFLADLGPRPSSRHSIDRLDNDGDYESGNCRWATRKDQANNKRTNRKLTLNGETLSCAEWARRLCVSRYVIFNRLRSGWTVERTLTTPLQWVVDQETGARVVSSHRLAVAAN